METNNNLSLNVKFMKLLIKVEFPWVQLDHYLRVSQVV